MAHTHEEALQRIALRRAAPESVARPKATQTLEAWDDITEADIERLYTPVESQIQRIESDLKRGNEWSFGFEALDSATLGGARAGQMVVVIGRAHTGKTAFVANCVAKNAGVRTMWISPDETELMFWGKFASMQLGLDRHEFLWGLHNGNEEALRTMREAMRSTPHVCFQHASMSVDDIDKALRIATRFHWDNKPPQVLVFDYLELVKGGEADMSSVQKKIESLKQLISDWRLVGVILHQSSRGAGSRGSAGGIEGGKFGGDREAHFLIETWRLADTPDLDEDVKRAVEDEISIGLWKNKAGNNEKCEFSVRIDSAGRLLEAGKTWEQTVLLDETDE